MEKPVIILKEEFSSKLTDVINDSKLPAFIIRPILQDALNQIISLEKKELDHETARYNGYLSEQEEKKKKSTKKATAVPYNEEAS